MCHADVCVCANRWSRCTLYVTLMVVCVCADCGLFLHDWAHQQVSVLALAFSGFLPVCIYPCMHTQVWIYTSMYVSIYAHVCVYIYSCIHGCTHTHTHVYICIHPMIYVHAHTHACTHTHMCRQAHI